MQTDRIDYPRGVTLVGRLHSRGEPLRRFAWSPDGTRIAAPSADGNVYLWSLGKGGEPARHRRHTGGVYTLAWSPDGTKLASASMDSTAVLWDAETGESLATLEHDDQVHFVSFSADGTMMATGARDRSVRVFSVGETLKPLYRVQHRRGVDCILWWEEEGTVISSSADADIQFWDILTGNNKGSIRGLNGGIHYMVWLGGRRTLAAACADWKIKIVDAAGRKVVRELIGHGDEITSLSVSPGGDYLASRSMDGGVCVWRCDGWEDVLRLQTSPAADEAAWCSSLAFHPAEPLLAVPDDEDRDICVFRLDEEALLRPRSLGRAKSYVMAKVVLLGESSVGKSGLAGRLSTGAFKPTTPTHGATCTPVEVEREFLPEEWGDDVAAQILLWDFAGQQVYHLVHHIFLDNCHAGLLLTDCKDKADPFRGVVAWARALTIGSPGAHKYLVFSRCDMQVPLVSQSELLSFLGHHDFSRHYYVTSALDGSGVTDLLRRIKQDIPWHSLTPQTESDSYHRLRAFILGLQKVVVSLATLLENLRGEFPDQEILDEDVRDVLSLLDKKGEVYCTELNGELLVILRRDLIDCATSAIIRKAGEQIHGYGAVAVRAAQSGSWIEREALDVPPELRPTLCTAAVELLINHGLCFEEDGRLIFPTEFGGMPVPPDISLPRPEVTFDFGGGIEQAYASLIVMMRGRMPESRLELFNQLALFYENELSFFLRLHYLPDNKAKLEIGYGEAVSTVRGLRLVHRADEHLRKWHRHTTLHIHHYCPNESCGREVSDRAVLEYAAAADRKAVICQYCETRVPVRAKLDDLMARPARRAVKKVPEVFISYAHEDVGFLEALKTHLSTMVRNGEISPWYDQNIMAGGEWDREIHERLKSANVILLLVSPHFLASDYCTSVEMNYALKRHESGEATVIPILLRVSDWGRSPLQKLQALPTGARPVTKWGRRDEAYQSIIQGLRAALNAERV